MLYLGPLNALVVSIKDFGMVPLGTSGHHSSTLSYMSFRALTPFGSKAVVSLNDPTHLVEAVLVP